MSPTRKSRPPDKADSGHKPSRKVAIDDVLRTLQDLVQNELSVEDYSDTPPKAGKPPSASAAVDAAAEPPPPAGIVEELPASALDESLFGDESITLEALPDVTPETPAPGPVPPGGLQQELPHLDTPETGPLSPSTAGSGESILLMEPETPIPELPDTGGLSLVEEQAKSGGPARPLELTIAGTDESPLSGENETPSLELPDTSGLSLADDLPPPAVPDEVNPEALPELHDPGFTLSMDATTDTARGGNSGPGTLEAADDNTLNDIPTLEDAVEPEELHHDAATTLPAAADGRRLAIQVAARLNVELRKQGQAGLSSDVIARLARLLEEALAKGPANMENSRSVKH